MNTPEDRYQVLQDDEGFYIGTVEGDWGWDLCRTYRFGSYADAEAEMQRWIADDYEAEAIEQKCREEAAS